MRPLCLAIITLIGLLSAAPAQTPSPAPIAPAAVSPDSGSLSPEAMQILKKLTAVKASFDSQKQEVAASALARYTAGAQSEATAVALYMSCLQIVQGRVPDLDGTTKQEARGQQDRLKAIAERNVDSPGRAALLQMQLQFLVFTMQAPAIEDRGAVMSRLEEFATRAVGLLGTYYPVEPPQKAHSGSSKSQKDKERAQEARESDAARRDLVKLAKADVMGSLFAEAYNLSYYFKRLGGWPKSLMDLDVIFTSHLIPYTRSNKPELLAKEWEDYIKLTTALEKLTSDEASYARWLVGPYKNLQWKRAMDLLRHGTDRSAAADELVTLVKENPTHPSISTWVTELEKAADEILNPTAPVSTPALR